MYLRLIVTLHIVNYFHTNYQCVSYNEILFHYIENSNKVDLKFNVPIPSYFIGVELELNIKLSKKDASFFSSLITPPCRGSIMVARILTRLPHKRSLLLEPFSSGDYDNFPYGIYWYPEIDVYVLEDQGTFNNILEVPGFVGVDILTRHYLPTVSPAIFTYNKKKVHRDRRKNNFCAIDIAH